MIDTPPARTASSMQKESLLPPKPKMRRAQDLCRLLEKDRVQRMLMALRVKPTACTVTELEVRTGLRQSVVSSTLAELRKYRIVNVRREGRWHLYSINKKRMAHIRRALKIIDWKVVDPKKDN